MNVSNERLDRVTDILSNRRYFGLGLVAQDLAEQRYDVTRIIISARPAQPGFAMEAQSRGVKLIIFVCQTDGGAWRCEQNHRNRDPVVILKILPKPQKLLF